MARPFGIFVIFAIAVQVHHFLENVHAFAAAGVTKTNPVAQSLTPARRYPFTNDFNRHTMRTKGEDLSWKSRSSSCCYAAVKPSQELQRSREHRHLSWMDRYEQLLDYQRHNDGSTLVPKRYADNPSLGLWVQRQRQKFNQNAMPLDRMDALNKIGFCWAVKGSQPSTHEENWWKDYELWKESVHEGLAAFKKRKAKTKTAILHLPVSPWLRAQQKEILPLFRRQKLKKSQQNDLDEPKLTSREQHQEKKIQAMDQVDPYWWKSARQRNFERRYKELVLYKTEHGDCCVPRGFAANKSLALWVANQRKKHRQGKYNFAEEDPSSSSLSKCDPYVWSDAKQYKMLQDIGFVWARWDFEFEKQVQWAVDPRFRGL